MATIQRTMTSRLDANGKGEILLRLNVSRAIRLRLHSGIYVDARRFKDGKFILPRADQDEATSLRKQQDTLSNLEMYLIEKCENTPLEQMSKDYFQEAIFHFLNPAQNDAPKPKENSFFELLDEYIQTLISEWPKKHHLVLKHALQRYEKYIQLNRSRRYKLTVSKFDTKSIDDFNSFLRSEDRIGKEYPEIYEIVLEDCKSKRKTPKPTAKSANTIVGMMKRLRGFFSWCIKQGIITQNPYDDYTGPKCEKYGKPIYITIKERDKIDAYDFSNNRALETQRDIFVFQCLIGCRISDLLKMRPSSIVDGFIEYLPQKTKGHNPKTVRVPLTSKAKTLISKYEGVDKSGRLFPFISAQKYNAALKKIFTIVGITRLVWVINPKTGEEEQRPINDVASSHMARKTFCGNLWKKVKDPDLVSSMSGHAEGSRAFQRYRDIDDDVKLETINLLEEL